MTSTKSSVVLDREPDQEKSLDPSGPRIRCPLCDWSPASTTAGLVAAVISGTRSIREEDARHASVGGLQPSASSAAAGPRIRIGIRNDLFMLALGRHAPRQPMRKLQAANSGIAPRVT
jgi:hypothetical protein